MLYDCSAELYKTQRNLHRGFGVYGSEQHSKEHIAIAGIIFIVGLSMFIYGQYPIYPVSPAYNIIEIIFNLFALSIVLPHLRYERKSHKNGKNKK